MSDPIEFDPFADAIAELNSQIGKLQAAVAALESVRPMMSKGAVGNSQRGSETAFGHDAFFQMSGSDAAKKYLTAIKKTASAKTIADALIAGGWKTASKNPPENLRTILNRNPQFVVIKGEFGLSEWYPGRKSSRTPRAVSPAPHAEGINEPVEEDIVSVTF